MAEAGLTPQEDETLSLLRSNDRRATSALMALDDDGRARVLARMTGVSGQPAPPAPQTDAASDISEAGAVSGGQGESEAGAVSSGRDHPAAQAPSASQTHEPTREEGETRAGSTDLDDSTTTPSGESTSDRPIPAPPVQPREPEGWTGLRSGGWITLRSGRRVELAHPAARIVARLLDGVVLTPLWILGMIGRSATIGAAIAVVALMVIGAYLYELLMLTNKGQTVGKMAMNIRIVGADDGLTPDAGMATRRWLVPQAPFALPLLVLVLLPSASLSGAVILLSLSIVLGLVIAPIASMIVYGSSVFDQFLQGWHDKIGGTLVINVGDGSSGPVGRGGPIARWPHAGKPENEESPVERFLGTHGHATGARQYRGGQG